MQTISSMNPARSPRRIAAISIGILSVLTLASCGGGGSTDPNATAQSADEATKNIQGVSGSTAVPGTWTGRAPKMEVINGITVPPEPAPTINNATLAGVDVNNNGVRDDVERVVARSSSNFNASMQIALAYGWILSAPEIKSRTEALRFYSKILCATSTVPQATFGASNKLLRDAIFNTNQRKAMLNAANKALDGGLSPEELPPCSQ